MPFPSPGQRNDYFKLVTRVGRASADPASISGLLFSAPLRPYVVSVAPVLRPVGGALRPTLVVGVDAAVVDRSELAAFTQNRLSSVFGVGFGQSIGGSGVRADEIPWSVRRELRPANQSCSLAPRVLGGPARPGDVICTVRPSSRHRGAEYLDSGGTLGGWVLVGGESIGLVSCAHVLATRLMLGDRASRRDVVTWPGWRRVPMAAEAAMSERAVAELSRWPAAGDEIDAALAILTPGASRAGIAVAEDARLVPRREADAEVGDVVRFMGAACADVREGAVESTEAQAEIPETGEIGSGFVTYGADLGDGIWESVTLPGDSGAWLIRGDGAAVAMHKMAAVALPNGERSRREGISTLSYAQPLCRVLRALGRACDLVQRETNVSLRLLNETLEVLPPDLVPARGRSRTAGQSQPLGDRAMDSNVTYQFFFGDACRCAPVPPSDGGAEAPQVAFRPVGNQGFPRFSRVRLANGFAGDGSGRKVTSGTATPARPHPVAPNDLGPGAPIPLAPAPIADQMAVAHGLASIGSTPANQTPSKIDLSITHTKPDGSNAVTTTLMVDFDLILGDDFGNNFITEVDIELTRLASTRVKFEVYVTYQLATSTIRVLGPSKVETVQA